MSRKPQVSKESRENTPRSLYDPEPVAEEDLWFLPGPDGDAVGNADNLFLPDPRVDPQPLFDPAAWCEAQDALSLELANLAANFGALDERLRAGPKGWGHLLALLEVGDLGWWTGDRIGAERLALWVGMRIGATGDDAQAMFRAGWAVRRLTSGAAPEAGGWKTGLVDFLSRTTPEGHDMPEAVADLAEVMESMAALHPITRSTVLFHVWRALGQGVIHDCEAAVLAARHAASTGRGHAMFVPLCLSGPGAFRGTGEPGRKLAAWIGGTGQAVLAALLHLDRVNAWQLRARERTGNLSGRTPPALIDVLTAWPMITAPLAQEKTGMSRAAIQRNLDILCGRGLVREMTGQGRYRIWTAAL